MIDTENARLLNNETEIIAAKFAPTWEQVSTAKKIEQWHRIPVEWRLPLELLQSQDEFSSICEQSGVLSPLEFEITEIESVLELSTAIQTKHYSVEAVITAFCKRAAIAHQM